MNLHDDNLNAERRINALSQLAHIHVEDESGFAPKRVFPTVVMGVFFVALLLVLIAGVMVYQSVSASTTNSNAARQGAGLVCNAVHANDSEGAVAVGEGPEGRSLVIVEKLDSGNYETRFYLYKGNVVQEYSLAGSSYTPENSSVVTESSIFEFSYDHGLLSVTTDQGTAETALRSMQGGN